MSYRRQISADFQKQIRKRANYLCEYCHTSEKWQYVRFTIDHIIPLSQNGTDDLENLCLACFHCNRRKGNKMSGIDTASGVEIPLFHPRKHIWKDHFIWSGDRLSVISQTLIGIVTVEILELNRERIIRIRAADLLVGRHPPENDPCKR